MRVLVIGAGGHAQVVASILLAGAPRTGHVPAGYIDDRPDLQGATIMNVAVLGTLADVGSIPHEAVIVAIGNNRVRQAIFERMVAAGERVISALHPSAVIADGVTIGDGTVVCAGVIVSSCSRIGANVILNTGSSIDHHNHISDHVHVGPGARTGGDVSIGRAALVGIGATVMPGRSVGAYGVVGAAALVQQDVHPGEVVVGVPARRLRLGQTGT